MDLYNVKDDEYCNYLKGLCLLEKPIPFYNTHINHFNIEQILIMSETNYMELISVFALNKKYLCNGQDLDYGLLDIIFARSDSEEIFQKIFEALMIIMDLKTKPELTVMKDGEIPHIEIVIEGALFVDSEKYEQLRNIILFINNIKEMKVDTTEQKSVVSEADKKRFEKLFKGRKRKQEKEKKRNSLVNIFNCVVHMQNPIDYEKVAKWSVCRLYNTFINLRVYEDYEFNRNIYSSGMADLKNVSIPIYFNEITKNE